MDSEMEIAAAGVGSPAYPVFVLQFRPLDEDRRLQT